MYVAPLMNVDPKKLMTYTSIMKRSAAVPVFRFVNTNVCTLHSFLPAIAYKATWCGPYNVIFDMCHMLTVLSMITLPLPLRFRD